MNIVYLLENIDKKTNPRKYIGFKTECNILPLEGIPAIYCNRENNYYFGSSLNPKMVQDLKNGNRFKATVLEKVGDRTLLPEKEIVHLKKFDAESNEEYYNLSSRLIHSLNQLDAPSNMFGETVRERANRESTRGTRDSSAKAQGFSNFGLMCFDIYERLSNGESGAAISRSMGKQVKYATRTIRDYDMKKAVKELESAWRESKAIRKDYSRRATLEKLHEIYGYEIPTLRVIIGDFRENCLFSVATELGTTKEELEISITKRILDGEGFKEVSEDTGISIQSVKRYFLRCIRSRLKSSDL